MQTKTAIALSIGLLLSEAAAGAAADPLPIGAESRVWFTGASNLRSFTCRAGELSGNVDLVSPEAGAAGLLGGEKAARGATLTVPVAGLSCGIGAMTRHLHEALKADSSPTIEFRLDDYQVAPGDTAAPVRMNGSLRIAGVEAPVAVDGVLARDTAGALHARGTHEVRVTDFGVQPPRRFLGLLRVRDRVTVHFDVVLPAPGATGAEAAEGES